MNDDAVLIDQLSVRTLADGQELSARVDGERVWFRFPAHPPIAPRAEPFLAIGLQEAMVRGVPLRLAPPHAVSARLLRGLEAMQRVFVAWNSDDFRLVPLEISVQEETPAGGWVLSAYSGGIDSSYTYVQEREAITHLLLVQGFDGNFGDDIWHANVEARAQFAHREGKGLIPVANNVRTFIERRRLSWAALHGSLLAALGVALGARQMFIPSTFTLNELFPWGSHPLLDPLWSSDATRIIHHGLEATRTAKTVAVASHPASLDHLQVCWRGVDKNCGHCPKCVRTSLALHLIGKASSRLPPFENRSQLRWLKPGNPASLAFTEDLIHFALLHQRPDLAKPLKSYRRHYLVKHHASELIKVYGARWARALARRFASKGWHGDRARMQAARSWLD